jgi:hypothetical protein
MVMLSLHRASGITLLLLLPIATWHLVDLLNRKDFVSPIVGLACVMPAFLQKAWGIPTIPALCVAILAFYKQDTSVPKWQKKFLIPIVIISIAYALFLCVVGYAKALEFAILGDRYVFLLLVFILLLREIAIKYKNLHTHTERISKILFSIKHSLVPGLMMGAITLLLASSIYLNWKKHPAVDINLARSYLDAQLWAKASTNPRAVFMPDPGMPLYGRAWSEYSRRASFGTVRDWLHVPIVYHSDLNVFKEGVRRLSLLGIDPYQYKQSAFSSPDKKPMIEHLKTIDAAREAYYSMSPEHLIDLAHREGISFFIFTKNYVNPPPNLVSVYENNHFVILAPAYGAM